MDDIYWFLYVIFLALALSERETDILNPVTSPPDEVDRAQVEVVPVL